MTVKYGERESQRARESDSQIGRERERVKECVWECEEETKLQ